MKRITQTDVIKSNDVNGNIISENKLEYSVERDISEFSGNELPSLSAVQQLVDQTIPPTEIPRILPWTSSEIVAQDYYRSHVIDGIEYLFRSLIDDNESEPSLSDGGDAWTDLGATSDGFSPDLWSGATTYNIGDFARIVASSRNIFKSKTNGNIGNTPIFNITDANWECVGTYVGLFNPASIYALDNVVFDAGVTDRVYRSNVNDNNYPLDGQISSNWQIIGAPSSSSSTSKGSFPSTDTGQAVINIPHGLTGTPSWFSVQGTNIISTGVINKSDLTIDSTNIIITPEFMNNDGEALNFLWKAEL